MISIRLGIPSDMSPEVLVAPVRDTNEPAAALPGGVLDEVIVYLSESPEVGKPGHAEFFRRPGRQPSKIIFVGTGKGSESDWRKAGAAVCRLAGREAGLSIAVPDDFDLAGLRGLAEGIWLADYRYRLRADKPDEVRQLRDVNIWLADSPERQQVLKTAAIISSATHFARDLTNTPSLTKTPQWMAEQIAERASLIPGISVRVREPEQLAEEGFGGILAVGGGSARGPRLIELSWNPPGATEHIVFAGKGITYDTGGIDIKPAEAMLLMRKDMSGAATVMGTLIAAAELNLPVRLTALAPLAENMISGSAWRSGDVVRHYGGLTSEVHNTDAEGRVVLADVLAYAAANLSPDVLVDVATLTGAGKVSLGPKIALLFTPSDSLAESLASAASEAGEAVWRMPLADEYAKDIVADIGDFNNAAGNPGAITAALYLREFTGSAREKWVHFDGSAPAWSEKDDAELSRGATGWGVRTLVRWLSNGRG